MTQPAPEPTPGESPVTRRNVLPPSERPWPLRPGVAMWLGPLLIVACVALRFGWDFPEGPPFPVWGIAYAMGAAGIYLTYSGFLERKQR